MLHETSTRPPTSKSEWWIRLASFAEAQRSGADQPERFIPVHGRIETRRRGLRLNAVRSLYLAILASGPRILRTIRGRRPRSAFQSQSGLLGRRF